MIMEATIKSRSGAIISIKGSSEEVDEILEFWQRREGMSHYNPGRYWNSVSGAHVVHAYEDPHRRRISGSPKAMVVSLIEEDFFNKYRTLGETREELMKKYGRFI